MFSLAMCSKSGCQKTALSSFDENGELIEGNSFCFDHHPNLTGLHSQICHYIETHDKIVGMNASGIHFDNENAINEEPEYTHAQVAAEGFIPYFGSMLISSSMLFLPQDLMMHYMSLESPLLNIPAAIVNPTYTHE